MRSIFIIEDHPVMSEGLARYFEGTGRWQIAGTAQSIAEAKTLLSPVDIVVLDIQLETEWGLDIIPWLRERYGEKCPPVAVYSGFSDYAHVSAALRMGVRGYICKSRNEAELEAALENVLRGRMCIDAAAEQKLQTVANAVDLLTKRETEILPLVKSGLSNKRIAERLGIRHRTVENILSCIYDKLGVHSRLELQKM
jgi:DNA-binding NarL/FixJ family response regulator